MNKIKMTFAAMACIMLALPVSAQNYRNSRYYNSNSNRLDYGRGWCHAGDAYYGLRIGPAFSTVNSDDDRLDGGDSQTGLSVGAIVGFPLSHRTPLYLETGLSYIEKGGKKDLNHWKDMTYDLNYLQMPIVLKYKYNIDRNFSIQPFLGGYMAVGVGGKIKNFEEREAYSSFSDDAFQRFDGGLRFGCGMAYDLFYADITYDLGLSNICHDYFDTSHNGCLSLNVGVNF